MSSRVLFTSKTWGGDYIKYLQGEFEKKIPPYDFDDTILFLNNNIPEEIKFNSTTIRVSEYEDIVLKFFNLDKDSFNGGYNYSIEELTELWYASWTGFDYICHYASDCWGGGDWITEGLRTLRYQHKIKVVSPASRVNTWHNKKGIDQFFSDQCYLIPVKWWCERLFNIDYPDIKEFPSDAGDTFEKKCAQILRRTNSYRKILDNHWYEHQN